MLVYINTEEIASTYQTLGNLYTTEIIRLGEETIEQRKALTDLNGMIMSDPQLK